MRRIESILMPDLIAHRGLRSEAPENTIESISRALLSSVSGVEFDVELSADNVPVVIHQSTIVPDLLSEQLVLGDRNEIRNWVNESLFLQICSFDAGSWFDPSFSHVRVPTLDEVLALSWQNKRALVELKDPYYWIKRDHLYERRIVDGSLPVVEEFIDRGGLAEIHSCNEYILKRVADTGVEVPLVWTLWLDCTERAEQVVEFSKAIGLSGVSAPDFMLIRHPEFVERVLTTGLSVYAYEVTRAANDTSSDIYPAQEIELWRQLVELGVSGIINDTPRECLELLLQSMKESEEELVELVP